MIQLVRSRPRPKVGQSLNLLGLCKSVSDRAAVSCCAWINQLQCLNGCSQHKDHQRGISITASEVEMLKGTVCPIHSDGTVSTCFQLIHLISLILQVEDFFFGNIKIFPSYNKCPVWFYRYVALSAMMAARL